MRPYGREKLEQVIEGAPERSAERAEAMAELAWNVWTNDPARAAQLSRDALDIAESGGHLRARAYAQRNVGLLLFQGANLEESMGHLNDALHWFESNNDKSGEGDVRIGQAHLYWGFGDFKRGLDEGLRALALYKEAGDVNGQGWALAALGGFYHDWNDHRQSREYYEQAQQAFGDVGNQAGIGRALNGIGSVLALMGQYDEAREYQERSLEINRLAGNQLSVSKTLNDIGLLLRRQGVLDEALNYHREALEIRQQLSYTTGEITCLLDIGHIQIELREYDEARDVINRALVLSEQIRSKPKMCRAHELLSNLYRDLMQFDTALVHFENFHRIREEVYHEDAETKLNNIRTAYKIEAAEREAEIYRLKNVELKGTLDQLKNTQAQLVQAGKMAALGQLVAGLTHEVNQPIGAIRSATDLTSRALQRIGSYADHGDGAGQSGELGKLIDLLRTNNDNTASGAARLEKILRSLQSFSRIDEAEFQKTDIHEGLESTLILIGPEIPEGVKVEKVYGKVPKCYAYPGELNQVFMNLLLNAVAAVDGKGRVRINTSASDGVVTVEISDNGRGIEKDRLKTLFDPGFTTRESRVHMRTGLYTSYGIIHKHHGDIEVQSEPGKGTTFTVTFPDHLDKLI